MDVDATTSGPAPRLTKLTDEERKKLSSEGRCFRCRKQGHMARNCPQNAQGQPSWSGVARTIDAKPAEPAQVITNPGPKIPLTKAQQIAAIEASMTEEERGAYLDNRDMEDDYMKCRAMITEDSNVNSMYSNKKDSMTVDVQLYMWHRKAQVEALLDCGATDNFIDQRVLETLGMGTRSLEQPRIVRNADGTTNKSGTITEYCNLFVKRGEQVVKQTFFVANLGKDRLILGHPWFKTFNPEIDWAHNELKGEEIVIETAGYQQRKRLQPMKIDNVAQQWAERAAQTKPAQTSEIPEEYARHTAVFLEKAAQRFPPAREEDHCHELVCRVHDLVIPTYYQ